jgi:hypothetical protein
MNWMKDKGFYDALHRERGSMKPIVVFLYSSTMAKNCCSANFERALFRDKYAAKEFESWSCYKQQMETLKENEKALLAGYDLRDDKPALLFLDAEGGLLHKQQLCVDPPKFVKVIKSSKKLSDLRLRLRDSHLAQRKNARDHMEAGRYGRAIRVLASMVKNKKVMSGHIVFLVEQDMKEIESTATEMLDRAAALHEDRQLLDSYRLYEEIEKEFARLEDLSKQASKHRKELLTKLRGLGIQPRR